MHSISSVHLFNSQMLSMSLNQIAAYTSTTAFATNEFDTVRIRQDVLMIFLLYCKKHLNGIAIWTNKLAWMDK